jgi:hypothetical protein
MRALLTFFARAQVSEAALDDLLALASRSPTLRAPPAPLPQAAAALLRRERLEALRREACERVALPQEMRALLKDLRTHLQEKAEPPVYVSGARGRASMFIACCRSMTRRCIAARADRRLLKAIALLRVSAHTCGRRSVDASDALLLEHVLWQRPADAQRIRQFVLQRMSDLRRNGAELLSQQVGVLLDGLSQRAARPGHDASECSAMAAEAANLCKVRMTTSAASVVCAGITARVQHACADARLACTSSTGARERAAGRERRQDAA